MKAITLALGVAALFAFSVAQACPGMDKVTKSLKTYTGDQLTDAGVSPVIPDADKKLIVDIKKPAETAN